MFDCLKSKPAAAGERPNPVEGATPAPKLADPFTFQGSLYNAKRLWYPPAIQYPKKMKKVWTHDQNYTKGFVVHFNAGRHNPLNTMAGGIDNGYMYDAMGPDGIVHQANDLSEAGYHTGGGPCVINGKTYSPMHRFCRGLEITSAGKLDGSGKSWFGVVIDKSKIREVKRGGSIRESGLYEKYTDEQEKGLIAYVLWLKWNNPSVFDFDFVIGHEECSTQKNDPGGALSMNMADFRAHLKAEYQKLLDTAGIKE